MPYELFPKTDFTGEAEPAPELLVVKISLTFLYICRKMLNRAN